MIRLFSFKKKNMKDYRTHAPFYPFYSLNFVAKGTNGEMFG